MKTFCGLSKQNEVNTANIKVDETGYSFYRFFNVIDADLVARLLSMLEIGSNWTWLKMNDKFGGYIVVRDIENLDDKKIL